jgi:hypothetical protein
MKTDAPQDTENMDFDFFGAAMMYRSSDDGNDARSLVDDEDQYKSS